MQNQPYLGRFSDFKNALKNEYEAVHFFKTKKNRLNFANLSGFRPFVPLAGLEPAREYNSHWILSTMYLRA